MDSPWTRRGEHAWAAICPVLLCGCDIVVIAHGDLDVEVEWSDNGHLHRAVQGERTHDIAGAVHDALGRLMCQTRFGPCEIREMASVLEWAIAVAEVPHG
jgi:hypothetical protein